MYPKEKKQFKEIKFLLPGAANIVDGSYINKLRRIR